MDEKTPIDVSVVLPCYNGGPLLAVQLDAIAAQEFDQPWELVFVDNASTDGSADMARAYQDRIPNLRVIDASAEKGQPFALNTGIKAAAGSRIILCDADDEVAPGWLRAMAAALSEHPLVASRMDQRKLNPKWLQSDMQWDTLQKLWYPPYSAHGAGATLGFHKSLFEDIGSFESSLPYLHDTEFCIQAGKRGVAMHLVTDAVVHYRRRTSLKAHMRQSRNYAVYNTILARRHQPEGGGVLAYWARFLRDWFRILLLLRRIRSTPRRYELAWMYGRQLGRIEGVIRFGGIPV